LPHWRKMTWLILIFTALMATWAVAGAATADNAAQCARDAGGLSQQACTDARNAGTGLGVALIVLLWFFGFVVLSLVAFMTRPKGRPCPVCGTIVKRGRTACPSCGHDFAAAARTTVSTHPG
jgi:hypothetical protein